MKIIAAAFALFCAGSAFACMGKTVPLVSYDGTECQFPLWSGFDLDRDGERFLAYVNKACHLDLTKDNIEVEVLSNARRITVRFDEEHTLIGYVPRETMRSMPNPESDVFNLKSSKTQKSYNGGCGG